MSSELEQSLRALAATRERIAAESDSALAAQLTAVRHWQSQKMAALHQPTANRYDGDALLAFLTQRFYLDADWSELTAHPERVAGRVHRIINDARPLVIAVQLQESADRLDAQMAQALITQYGSAAISTHRYVHAFRAVGSPALRRQQIRWVEELVHLLSGYADNRTAYWAFKLASGPARALGMGRTYAILADGFAAMRATRDLDAATQAAVATQERILDRLLQESRTRG